MKNLKSYIVGAMVMAAAMVGFSSCQDSFDEPNAGDIVPVASMEVNTTIAEVKELMWSEENNYCDTVPAKENGEHIIVAGRVISSDYAGNCFKYIVLQDETGALTFSINSYNLYLNYRRGQEIVVDLTGLHIGKYRGLEQVGFPAFNSSVNGYETSFMSPERFKNRAELNGMPDLAQIDTIQVSSFGEIGSTPAEVRRWQSQLVRFNNVEFVPNATTPTFSTYHSSGVTQQISDAEGNTMDIRTSGYSNFWNQKLPEGKCDVVAIMGYYINLAGSGGWQLTLIDANAVMNLGNPTVPQGSQSNPFDVIQAIAHQANSENVSGWVKGYIVGTVAPEVETIMSNDNIEWTANPTLGNTLVIGQTPETKDIAECLVIALPQGSDLRNYGALRENPKNYGKEITIKGTFAKFMGTYGITGNSGSSSEFTIEGMEPVGPVAGDGSEGKPYNVNQVLSKGADASEIGVWITGYIVGSVPDKTFSEATFSASGASTTNIIIAASASETDINKCIPVQLPSGAVRTALNLSANSDNLGKQVSLFGDIAKYFGVAGFKNTSEYVLGAGGGGSTTPDVPDTPVIPSGDYKGNFDTFNESTPKSSYGTYTNATGWTATNCAILGGLAEGATDQNPRFAFIGGETTLAPTLNGKVSAPGVLESPVLTGSCGKLTFNYGFAFKETQCKVKIEVLQGDKVVKEDTIEISSIEQKKAYSHSLDVNVSGDFKIKLTNLCASASDSNKDRISVWNLTWTE